MQVARRPIQVSFYFCNLCFPIDAVERVFYNEANEMSGWSLPLLPIEEVPCLRQGNTGLAYASLT